jgi:hypothetical protein
MKKGVINMYLNVITPIIISIGGVIMAIYTGNEGVFFTSKEASFRLFLGIIFARKRSFHTKSKGVLEIWQFKLKWKHL